MVEMVDSSRITVAIAEMVEFALLGIIQSFMGMCMIHFLQTAVLLLWILLVGHIQDFQYFHLMMPMEPRLAPLGRPTVMANR